MTCSITRPLLSSLARSRARGGLSPLLIALAACGGGGDKAAGLPLDAGTDVTSAQRPDASVSSSLDASQLLDAGALDASSVDAAPRASDAAPHEGAAWLAPDAATLSTDYLAWQASLSKLRSCGLVGEGVWPFDPQVDLRCKSLCIVAASCAELQTESCDLLPAAGLDDCLDGCVDDDISCGDGSTAPYQSVCDLKNDCRNGEDEQRCDTFRCTKGGTVIADAYRCDGSEDCSDGSDEVDCALLCGKPRALGQ